MPSPSNVLVSVVIPAREAGDSLPRAVQSALQQVGVDLEVVIVVAEEHTKEVACRLAAGDRRIRVVDNPARTTPAALNRGIASSRGDVIVRLDAHSTLPAGYVAAAVQSLDETGAGNVGGRQVPRATDGFAAAVAAAMRSTLGSGGAAYRRGGQAGPVETVYLGVFRREALEEVGGFDERLLRNQDYELNHRLRRMGWQVWFDPRLAVEYQPRSSVRALARQYADYGRYKRQVMQQHPSSIRVRQLLPLAMASGVSLSVVAGVALGTWWPPLLTVGGYLGLVGVGSVMADRRRAASVAVALITMHWAWAIGFLLGPRRSQDDVVVAASG